VLFSILGSIFSLGLVAFNYGGSLTNNFITPLLSSFFPLLIWLLATFTLAGLIQTIMVLFKSEGKAKDSFNVCLYSMIPFLIFSAIPLVGYLSIVYSFFLMIIGISKVHNVSKGKAALACLLPVVLVIGLLGILFIYVLSNLSFW